MLVPGSLIEADARRPGQMPMQADRVAWAAVGVAADHSESQVGTGVTQHTKCMHQSFHMLNAAVEQWWRHKSSKQSNREQWGVGHAGRGGGGAEGKQAQP